MKRLSDAQIQALKFTLLSLSAGPVEAGPLALMELLFPFWPYWAQHEVSLTLSVIWNSTLDRRCTFKSASNIPRAMLLVAAFYAVFIPVTMRGGELAARGFAVTGLGKGGTDTTVKIATMLLNSVLGFVWWKLVVFHGTENTNDLARCRDWASRWRWRCGVLSGSRGASRDDGQNHRDLHI